METSLSRNEKLIGLMALAAVTAFALMFLQINSRANSSVSQIDPRSQINYQMARPDERFSEYSLNGREIDQQYEALQKKQAAQVAAAKNKKPAVPAKVDAAQVAKLKAEAAQKVAATQAAATKARATQAAQAAQTAQAQKAAAEAAAHREARSNDPSSTSENAANASNVAAAANPAAAPVKPATDPEAKAKKTFAQWRALIYATPTQESINTFLEAYRKGDVTATEVQAMSQDLLDQNDEKLKGLGLYSLRSTPSLASLSQLVHIEGQLSATYKSYVEQAYLSYLQPQNVTYLNQALLTKDKTLIVKSLNILGVSLQKVAAGQNSALVDPRSGRAAGAGSNITMASFSGLMPALTTLGSSQDQDLAPLAQLIIGYIQTSSVVAQT